VYEHNRTADMLNNVDVVVIIPPKGNKQNESIPSIRGLYQFRTTYAEDGESRIIHYREVACWCPFCIKSDYINCLVQSRWESLNLVASPKQKQLRKCSVCNQAGHNKSKCLTVGTNNTVTAGGGSFNYDTDSSTSESNDHVNDA